MIVTHATAGTNSLEVKFGQALILGDEYTLLIAVATIVIFFLAFAIKAFCFTIDPTDAKKSV